MAGWAALTFVGWNAATVWWIWIATPVGPLAATFFSTMWNMLAFMLFHYVSKRAPKSVAYTVLVAAWVAAEYLYTYTEVISFPWLTLGNGFSGDVWAVQWYEYTGVMGGSMWVLLSNIVVYEALVQRSVAARVRALTVIVLPLVASLCIYFTYSPTTERAKVAVIQPNVDCYNEKFNNTSQKQFNNLMDLISQTPSDAQIIVMPETALPSTYDEDEPITANEELLRFSVLVGDSHPSAMLTIGATSVKSYDTDYKPTPTARESWGMYYDVYNSALAVGSDKDYIHHKMRLVIGVEAMPLFFNSFIDLGGISGQLGRNDKATVFEKNGLKVGPAVCYEGLYGEWFARFVREGAEVMLVMSNDGWWGNTPGHRRLFDFCRLRAIETRRAVARSANTGISGFITSRGDVDQRLEWDERGVLVQDVERSTRSTMYVLYGDWVGRMALLVTFLAVMYFMAYRIRRRNHLVD
jgi:apolipoprotein N-acyltransferase